MPATDAAIGLLILTAILLLISFVPDRALELGESTTTTET